MTGHHVYQQTPKPEHPRKMKYVRLGRYRPGYCAALTAEGIECPWAARRGHQTCGAHWRLEEQKADTQTRE